MEKMDFKLRFSNNAQFDVIDAYSYYEDISVELADKFMSNLDSCYDKIVMNPQHYGYCDFIKEYRDYSMKIFPCQI